MNGDITPTSNKPADVEFCDSTDVTVTTDSAPKPSAERCRLSVTGDHLCNDAGSPLSATSPMSENAGDCCESDSGSKDCGGVGMLLNTGFPRLLESPGFFLEYFRTWKVLENHFGPGKSWKLKLKVLESPGKYP